MAKQTTSLGSLVNLAELNKLAKKADTLIVGSDSGMTIICNGHWIARLRLPQDAAIRATIFSRLGTFPEDGTALRVVGKNDAGAFSLDELKKFFSGTFYCECHDTYLSHDLGEYDVRIFHCKDHELSKECYIALGRHYFNMVANYTRAASEKCSKATPIMFTGNYDEALLILPVNYDPSDYLSRV